MKNKGKKSGLSKKKNANDKKQQWIDKKKKLRARQEALKKIYDHFKNKEQDNQ
ncbi:MAG: hypothetical protein K9G58_15295 [Bacteroidales bacterium]|nr:hypothetical protein [Bacteroidales bacterium]MCF8388524.1 hypothetical protein [Bacteroidales bacterium]MCF8399534.1 hypothetical protein [Bacteroidales bacterium]